MPHFSAQALLFDLDGTLVHSIAAVDRVWRKFAILHGLDPAEAIRQIHGRRSIDSIRLLLPHLDPVVADDHIQQMEAEDTDDVLAISGAIELICAWNDRPWGIVTSGVYRVAAARIAAASIPNPPILVHGNDVRNGKPDPEPYLLGAERLRQSPANCLAFEDTAAGVAAAQAAGMRVIALTTTVKRPELAGADAIIDDFRLVRVTDDGVTID